MVTVHADAHPLLDAAVLSATLPAPLGELATPQPIRDWFAADAARPVTSPPVALPPVTLPPNAKTAVRDLLRHGGFKPAGRSKPASEYLIKAREKGWLSPDGGINAVVDALNAVSLHSGLPISVIDLDRANGPFRIGVCEPGSSYVFNASGQEIGLTGLIALRDVDGPCANPVKDSQRTKTHDGTIRTLSVVWGTHSLPGHTQRALDWYRALLQSIGALCETVPVG